MKISEAEFISQCMESNECTLEEFHDYYEVFPCDCEGYQLILKENSFTKMWDEVLKRNLNVI